MSRSARAALDVVSAAYHLHGDDTHWLAQLVEASRPALDRGLGIVGHTFRINAKGTYDVGAMAAAGDLPDGGLEVVRRVLSAYSASEIRGATKLGFASLSDDARRFGVRLSDYSTFEPLRRIGIFDAAGFLGTDPTGVGYVITTMLPEETSVTAEERERWTWASLHVLAGMRLRAAATELEGEAVIDGKRRVVHATGEARNAREALREAAAVVDRARSSSGRRDPHGALEAWRALVKGRWTLVDRFDRDGRRYLVARRNDPEVSGPGGLSQRVLQVLAYAARGVSNKHIAYALGLAPSTVSSHLRTGMRALGIRNRADLAAVFQPAEPGEG